MSPESSPPAPSAPTPAASTPVKPKGRSLAIVGGIVVVLLVLAVFFSGVIPGFSLHAFSSGSSSSSGYAVTFTETGLLAGTSWSVNFSGLVEHSTTTQIAFSEPAGVYAYTVANASGYAPIPNSGHVTVSNAAVGVPVAFYETYLLLMSSPSGSSPAAGVSWESIVIDPTSGLTTGIFGLNLTAVGGGAITIGTAPVTTCKAGATFSAANCGAPASGNWYSVLVYGTNDTVANVLSGSSWTGAAVTLNSAMELYLVSGATSYYGTGDVLAAYPTGSSIVSGSIAV